MLYMLDTCICVEYLRGRNEKLRSKINSCDLRQIKIPVIVLAELLHGAYHSKRISENLKETMDFIADFEVVPFGAAEADAYARIRASLENKRQPITRNAALVTNNTREFSRIDGLKLDDWTL